MGNVLLESFALNALADRLDLWIKRRYYKQCRLKTDAFDVTDFFHAELRRLSPNSPLDAAERSATYLALGLAMDRIAIVPDSVSERADQAAQSLLNRLRSGNSSST